MSDRLAEDVVAWRELTDPSSITPAAAPVSLVRIVPTALTAVQEHLSRDRMTEHIGLLFGQVELAADTSPVVTILIAHPLDAAFASSTHVVMQRDDWPSAWRRLSSRGFDQQQLVGWYHSHPGHSIFLSTTDLQTQALWFRQPWHVALVFDPVSLDLGAFCGSQGRRTPMLILDEDTRSFTGL
ncbi:Mov34/MPN/PAD-1 family protein [Tunturiibacter gelidiferens]|uniref:Mov34/MPN/PAD-1 family protein n=1 Tax=Tunturiibacter gelidiferens TaxID=3069689 RepID=UPI003D9AFBB5